MVFKISLIICVLLLNVTLAQVPRGKRCRCRRLVEQLNLNKVIRLEIFPPSSKCENEEYVVVLKSSKKTSSIKCVNPNIREVKAILRGKNKKTKHIQVIRHHTALGKITS
ncbi:C-X-C motif chemokine 11-6-like [Rhinoderma darwinii]|uniref:C-X-C motif chemokine 11-6-like n=1 Tax=Rhinoderma darwinii TaxID=43563 RepID=UPI003F6676BC